MIIVHLFRLFIVPILIVAYIVYARHKYNKYLTKDNPHISSPILFWAVVLVPGAEIFVTIDEVEEFFNSNSNSNSNSNQSVNSNSENEQ